MPVINWSDYPNFTEDEFRCKHTGLCDMDPLFLTLLQQIRWRYAKPMIVTSGYRHPTHPDERHKDTPGEHTLGRAADIACSGADALRLIQIALDVGIKRIGVKQKGDGRFIHLGYGGAGLPPVAIWSY